MGRTQPSPTSSIEAEFRKLYRVARRVGDEPFVKLISEAEERVRYFQGASYDEDLDPWEVILLSTLSVVAEREERWRGM